MFVISSIIRAELVLSGTEDEIDKVAGTDDGALGTNVLPDLLVSMCEFNCLRATLIS